MVTIDMLLSNNVEIEQTDSCMFVIGRKDVTALKNEVNQIKERIDVIRKRRLTIMKQDIIEQIKKEEAKGKSIK